MIRETQWSPDTCSCVLIYTWDDALDENTRTHLFKKALYLCEHHSLLLGNKAYDQVASENTCKNIVWGEVQKIRPDLALEDYIWSFDKDRKLKVSFSGKLKAGDKDSLKTQFDDKFGVGKVEVI